MLRLTGAACALPCASNSMTEPLTRPGAEENPAMVTTQQLQTAIDTDRKVRLTGVTDGDRWEAQQVEVLRFDEDEPWVWVAEGHEYPIDLNEITSVTLEDAQDAVLF